MRPAPMLDLFRKRGLSSIVYGAVIIATVLVFVIQFRPNAGQKAASIKEACVAKVRGWCIDPKDHRASYRILIPRDQQGQLLTARAKQMGLSKIALDGLIERELLVNEADRIGLKVTDDEITEEIFNGFIRVSVPSDNPQLAYSLRVADGRIYAGFRDQKTHQFDMKAYERSIRMLVGRSPTEFREEQGRELLAAKVRDLVRAPVRVSEPEALEMYVGEKSSATLRYIPIKQSYVARYAVKVTPGDVDAWLKEKGNESLIEDAVKLHKDDDAPKASHIRHILIKTPPDAGEEQIQAANAKLSAAKARIDAGESFASVAREVSDDKGSAIRGGDVGDKTDGFVEPFKKAADALKAGEMTKTAIQTQFGLHLIEKDDPAKAAELEAKAKRDAAREQYTKSKALELTRGMANKVLAAIKSGTSPEEAVSTMVASLPRNATTAPLLPITRAEEPKAAGDAGAAGDGGKAAAGATEKKAAEAPKPITPETDPDRPQVLTSSAFNKGGDPIPGLPGAPQQEVLGFAFSGKDGDLFKEPIRTDDGFDIVQLKEHKAATKEEFEKDKETYLQTLLAAKQAEALALYVKRLREAAKSEIKIDETYLLDAKPSADGGAPAPNPFEEEEEP
jgi:peptidyl-prolyl cis-trans isomerase D